MRFSYDAFVLDNKKCALYYSGPFSATERNLALNKGEVFKVNVVNPAAGSVTAAVTGTGTKPTASVSGGEVTITTTSSTSSGDFVVTLTDASTHTTTINVTVA